jgi:hypothetical protein
MTKKELAAAMLRYLACMSNRDEDKDEWWTTPYHLHANGVYGLAASLKIQLPPLPPVER